MRGVAVVFNLFLTSSRLQKKRAVLTIASIAWGSGRALAPAGVRPGVEGPALGREPRHGERASPSCGLPRRRRPGRGFRPAGASASSPRTRRSSRSASRSSPASIGEFSSWGNNFTLRQEDGQRAAHRHRRRPTAICATTCPLPGGRFLNDDDVALRRRVVFLGRRARATTSSARSIPSESSS